MVSRLPYIFSTPKHGDVIVFDAQQIEPGERTFFDDYKDIVKYNLISTSLNKNISIEHKYYIKRVIGVPGDTIEIKEDGLYRNGELIQESYIKDQNWIKRYNATKENWEIYSSAHVGLSVKVSEGCVFVMGDNRLNSKDSRVIGEVSYDAIIGKVLSKGKTNDES
jgi:signal peptidase I